MEESEARELIGLDKVIDERSRRTILTIVWRSAGADYLLIRRLTGLSKGNLSNHLAKLEEAGLVSIEKRFVGKKPVTTVRLTDEGKEAIEGYWDKMERIAAVSRQQAAKASSSAGSYNDATVQRVPTA